MKTYLLLVLSLVFVQAVFSQTNSKSLVLNELKIAAEKYSQADHLSFNLSYRYARESDPLDYLDSLSGKIRVNKDLCWSTLDSTEMINGKDYRIALFKEDNLMMISKASTHDLGSVYFSGIDTLILSKATLTYNLEETDRLKKLLIDFPPELPYKKISIEINKQSGFIERVVSLVKSNQLYDPSVRGLMGEADSYVIVEVRYGNFAEHSFTDEVFDQDHYFRKSNGVYTTTPQFNAYKIFLSSSNL